MTGFPINPPRAPITDGVGMVTNEWYRFFIQIQRLIGGPSSPFDDNALIASAPSQAAALALQEGGMDLVPPVIAVMPDDALVPPSHSHQCEDLMYPPRYGV